MTYELYKIVHLGSIFLFIITTAYLLYSDSKKNKHKIFLGFCSLMIIFGGMGLMARAGYGDSWPLWLKIKLVIWLILSGFIPVAIKRFPQHQKFVLGGFFSLLLTALTLVVYKF